MRPEELPLDLFMPGGARLLHLTGITVALGPAAAATTQRALDAAKTAGWLVSFDVNYRQQLWTPEAARQGCDAYARAADILFVPRGDVCLLFGLEASMPAAQVLETVASAYPQATIVLTLGKEGAMAYEPPGQVLRQSAIAAEEVGRLGGGDAFAAGFLYAFLTTSALSERVTQGLRWGTAMAALKYTVRGDIPLVERQEVEALLQRGGGGAALQR